MRSIWTAAWVAVAVLVCLPAWAADAPVPVRIRVLQGFRQGAPGVPPGLEDLRGQLSATAYVRWEQAGEMQASMVPGKTQPVSLPAGGIGLGEARRGAAGSGHLRGERPGVADPVPGHGAAGEAHRAAGLRRAGRERLVRDHQGGGVAGGDGLDGADFQGPEAPASVRMASSRRLTTSLLCSS